MNALEKDQIGYGFTVNMNYKILLIIDKIGMIIFPAFSLRS